MSPTIRVVEHAWRLPGGEVLTESGLLCWGSAHGSTAAAGAARWFTSRGPITCGLEPPDDPALPGTELLLPPRKPVLVDHASTPLDEVLDEAAQVGPGPRHHRPLPTWVSDEHGHVHRLVDLDARALTSTATGKHHRALEVQHYLTSTTTLDDLVASLVSEPGETLDA